MTIVTLTIRRFGCTNAGIKQISQSLPSQTQAESQPITQVSGTFPCLKGHAVYMKNTSVKHNANVMTLYLTSTYCKKMNPTLNKGSKK